MKVVQFVVAPLIIVIFTAGLTFLGIRYYDFQMYKKQMESELAAAKQEIQEIQNEKSHLAQSIRQPVLYEAAPVDGIKEEDE